MDQLIIFWLHTYTVCFFVLLMIHSIDNNKIELNAMRDHGINSLYLAIFITGIVHFFKSIL